MPEGKFSKNLVVISKNGLGVGRGTCNALKLGATIAYTEGVDCQRVVAGEPAGAKEVLLEGGVGLLYVLVRSPPSLLETRFGNSPVTMLDC